MNPSRIGAPCAAALIGITLATAPAHAEQDTITLSTGETITVDVLDVNDESVRFVHPVLGEITVPRADVTVSADVVDAVVAASEEVQAAENAPAVVPADAKLWNSKFVLGTGYATGNTENANLNAQIVSTRETDRMITTLEARYFYSESNGVRSENRGLAAINNDWLVPESKWFYFARGQYDYDSYQDWDARLGLYGGAGYKWYDEADFNMNLRLGLGAIKEFGSSNDDVELEALIGVDGAWQISEKQSLTFDSTLYPNLSDTSEFRLVTNVGWSVLVDEASAMSLAAGIQHEYQSDVVAPTKENDVRLYAGLQFDF